MAELLIRQRGYGGTKVPLVVEDGGRIVSRDSISLPNDGDISPVRIAVAALEAVRASSRSAFHSSRRASRAEQRSTSVSRSPRWP
jgi:hypothetical protein